MPALIYFDYETGGLDPLDGAEPIELAALALDADTLAEVGRFPARLMRVARPENLDAKALEVNGKTAEQVMAGEDPAAVHEEFARWAADFIPAEDRAKERRFRRRPLLAGHNVKFDIAFLKWAFRRYVAGGMKTYDETFDYHDVCTFNIAYFKKVLVEKTVARDGKPLKGALVPLASYYGIPHRAHEAMGDVEAGAELLRRLRQELSAERAAFAAAGGALAAAGE